MGKLAIAMIVSVALVCDMIINLHPALPQRGWNESASIVCIWGVFAWWFGE